MRMGYGAYYLAWLAVVYLSEYPPLLFGLVALFLLRRIVPDPFVLLRTTGRIASLRQQIAANPANVTARRDLAMVYLDRLRPARALTLLDEAIQRAPEDAELLFLTGLARYQRGDHAGALEPLVTSAARDPRVRFGQAYLVAGKALRALGRGEEAVDAFERYVERNSSSMEGHVRLAAGLRSIGDRDGARRAIDEALATWRQLPGYSRRKEWPYWLAALTCKVVF